MRTLTELAWAGGLFEGEGCIFVARHCDPPQARLEIRMTDRDVLERFCQIVERGRVCGKAYHSAPNSIKKAWKWGVYDIESVRHILALFAPYLGKRRSQKAKEVLYATRNRISNKERVTKNN